MRLVVDASIAVKWSVIEQDSDLAAKLIESDHELIAPELLAVEVANALTSAWRRRTIDGEHADSAIARLPAIIGTFAPDA
jgi:predicted nucleic acid-binding protein